MIFYMIQEIIYSFLLISPNEKLFKSCGRTTSEKFVNIFQFFVSFDGSKLMDLTNRCAARKILRPDPRQESDYYQNIFHLMIPAMPARFGFTLISSLTASEMNRESRAT
jgi:hypothetical protein